MKAIIACGDRDWADVRSLYEALDEEDPDILIEGEAKGADLMARHWAEERGFDLLHSGFRSLPPEANVVGRKRFIPMQADWARFGKAAGPIRNGEMAVLLSWLRDEMGMEVKVVAFHGAIWRSKGTASMIRSAENHQIPVRLVQGDAGGSHQSSPEVTGAER
jgi:SLOG family YspA-like protein